MIPLEGIPNVERFFDPRCVLCACADAARGRHLIILTRVLHPPRRSLIRSRSLHAFLVFMSLARMLHTHHDTTRFY
jgi:hypothetical protein